MYKPGKAVAGTLQEEGVLPPALLYQYHRNQGSTPQPVTR